ALPAVARRGTPGTCTPSSSLQDANRAVKAREARRARPCALSRPASRGTGFLLGLKAGASSGGHGELQPEGREQVGAERGDLGDHPGLDPHKVELERAELGIA